MSRYELLHGDCLEKLKGLADNSVDAVVTDPPYGLNFMGKAWDSFGVEIPAGIAVSSTGINFKAGATGKAHSHGLAGHDGVAFGVWCGEWARECLRVLKPGGHLLSFGGTRTYHRLAVAIEDAGFEIRDSIHWVYGSGFPKSLDVSKAIDKAAGVEREVVGSYKRGAAMHPGNEGVDKWRDNYTGEVDVTVPATDAARQWSGWGTALKPSHEPIMVARKPLTGTVAANVLEWGTGALNIDGCRVATNEKLGRLNNTTSTFNAKNTTPWVDNSTGKGRFPPNTVFSHPPECSETDCAEGCAVAELDAQSGTLKSGTISKNHKRNTVGGNCVTHGAMAGVLGESYGDSGGASRFFPVFRYQAKAPPKERKVEGVEGQHPTQKPVDLMRWLVRLVTPPNGVVLDPFTGSGTTGVAAVLEGFRFIGCEREDEYYAIAKARLDHAIASANDKKGVQPTLFDLETP